MKRTTYIILGVISAIMLAHLILVVVVINLHAGGMDCFSFTEKTENQFAGVKAIKVDMSKPDGKYNFAAKVNVSSASEEAICRFEYPEKLADYSRFENIADTLYIKVDINAFFESPGTDTSDGRICMEDLIFDLQFDDSVSGLISESTNIEWHFSDVSIQELQIKTDHKIKFDSCAVAFCSFTGRKIEATHTKIEEMYLDLGSNSRFELMGGEIDRLFCTGDKKKSIRNKGLIHQLNWAPKDNESQLNIELHASTQILLSDK